MLMRCMKVCECVCAKVCECVPVSRCMSEGVHCLSMYVRKYRCEYVNMCVFEEH